MMTACCKYSVNLANHIAEGAYKCHFLPLFATFFALGTHKYTKIYYKNTISDHNICSFPA